MLPISRSTARILGGVGVIALSFSLTLVGIEYLRSPLEHLRPIILTFGDASASAITLSEGTRLQFPGQGYVQLQDTKDLRCRKFSCHLSLAVTFGPTRADLQFIVGQSHPAEAGWLLMSGGGHLVLQTEHAEIRLGAPFSPKLGQRYKIDIVRDEQEVKLSVDDMELVRSRQVPLTDLARDLTIGGRPGPDPLSINGLITDVHIARQRLRQ
jgi:hypothetical protein